MKPITHPLAIMALNEYVNGAAPTVAGRDAEGWRDKMHLFRQWSKAGCPIYADPTPMPAPALGMRAWYSRPVCREGQRESDSRDVSYARPGLTWCDLVGDNRVADIDIITDFRTGEVLWRRSE